MNYTEDILIARTKAEMQRLKLEGWSVKIGSKRSEYGSACFVNKVIEISLPCANLSNDEGLRETILHEIAHALCDKNVHHGKKWKDTYRKIGGNPEYVDKQVNTDNFYIWEVRCPEFCMEYNGALKRKRAECRKCGKDIEYRSVKKPEQGWHVYNHVQRGTMAWLKNESEKIGIDFSGQVAFAPVGYIWRSTETHAIDFGSDYYEKDSQTTLAEVRNRVVDDFEDGLMECHCWDCENE